MSKLMTTVGYANCVARVRDIETEVRKIQSQVGEVTTQSNETWHDNAPYSILVEELRLANIRLNEAHKFLGEHEIREYPTILSEPRVQYGTVVSLAMDGVGREFYIVGYGEDDFDKGKIVYACPLARVLIGRLMGERFNADINKMRRSFHIKNVTLPKPE